MHRAAEGRKVESVTDSPSPAGVLVVSSVRQDREALRRILRHTHRADTAGTCQMALDRLSLGGIAIVLCDSHLTDGTWLDILNRISTELDPPLLIVTSRFADERLWAEVLNLGGFDVIAKPFEVREVEHAVRTAWVCRHSPMRSKHFAGSA